MTQHITLTGPYAGTPVCGINKRAAAAQGDTFGHLIGTDPHNWRDACPACLQMLDTCDEDADTEAPAGALFDTSEQSPLFAGLPIQTPPDTGRAPTAQRLQAAWCCAQCGGPGPLLTTRAGAAICYACARQATTKRG
jgi:hypothetical protein